MDAPTLREAMGNVLSLERYQQLVAPFNQALLQAGCTNLKRAAMFCAQIGHESVGLKYQQEIWGPTEQQKRYDPSYPNAGNLPRTLGNTQPGDGARFKGHGWIQITGRTNHAQVSKWAYEKGLVPSPTFFVDQPDSLGADNYAYLGPVWYWTVARPQLNAVSDSGDVAAATRLINGGTYGLDDRTARYNRCYKMGSRILPEAATASKSTSSIKEILDLMVPFKVEYYDDQWREDADGLNWRAVLPIEIGGASAVINRGWARMAAASWGNGGTTFGFTANIADGKPILGSGVRTYGKEDDWWPIPDKSRMVTVEGRRDSTKVLVAPTLVLESH